MLPSFKEIQPTPSSKPQARAILSLNHKQQQKKATAHHLQPSRPMRTMMALLSKKRIDSSLPEAKSGANSQRQPTELSSG